MIRNLSLLIGILALAACTEPSLPAAPDSPAAPGNEESFGQDTSNLPPSDDLADDVPQDSDETSSLPTDPEQSPEPPPQTVRFVVLGDGGEGNATQFKVADAMKTVCDAKGGCEFALYLGDNFYDSGVDSVDDSQFESKFELPYANLDFAFYVVLGNHDYGITSVMSYKAEFEKLYHDISARWYMPNRYYKVTHEHVDLFGLDTNQFMVGSLMLDVNADDQAKWFDDAVAASSAQWKIAYGHHPYRSNGSHGNAGEYEGYSWLPFASGRNVEEFMDASFCDKIDIYFCGHDHNRQWLHPTCGVELVVSGAAAKTTALEGRGNDSYYEDDQKGGFLYVEIIDNVLTGEFYDEDGTLNFTRTVVK